MDWCDVLEGDEPNIDDEISNLQNSLSNQLLNFQSSMSGPVCRSMHRLLAKLKLDSGDELGGIFHLIESHGVSLRIKLENKLYKISRKPEKSSFMDKKFIEFKGDYYSTQQSFLKRLEQLPQEWTVVQISCAHDAGSQFDNPKEQLASTPTLHITRMECGPLASQPGHRPFCITIEPPTECAKGVYFPLSELDQLLECNRTDKLVGNKSRYWDIRRKVDVGLQELVSFMETSWLQGWKCLLPGNFTDQTMLLQLKNAVDRILKDEAGAECNFEELFPPKCRQILYCAAQNVHHCNSDQLSRVVGASIRKGRLSPQTLRLTAAIKSLAEEFCLWTTKRHPVILIIDERLDSIPWEKICSLVEQPVTRMPSLHLLQGLFEVHKNSVVNGLKIINPSKGFYIVNPDRTLPAMESDMREFLLPRVPNWSGTIGDKPSPQDFEKALHDSSTFVYMGHGSGVQFFSFNSLQHGITSTSLLFGCSSARLNMLGGDTESDGRVLIYPCQSSPCVMGMLWEVTDRDTNGLTKRLLGAWLPRNEDKAEEEKTVSEPELLRAMHLGRQGTKFYATSAALVARGLPVIIV